MPRNLKVVQYFYMQEALHKVESGSTSHNDCHNAAKHFLAIAQYNIPLATCLAIFLSCSCRSQPFVNVKTIKGQVARYVAQCNILDHETPIFKLNSLRDKLHSVTAVRIISGIERGIECILGLE